jgi:hypothetical protein
MGGSCDRFGATVGIKLGEDRRDMELGGMDRDRILWNNLLEAPAEVRKEAGLTSMLMPSAVSGQHGQRNRSRGRLE